MIILVGASASGKSVVVKKMIEKYNFKKVVTYTTRDIRVGEVNDVDYHFVSCEDFLNKKNNNFFLETAFYNNNYYGTAYEDISSDKVLIVDDNLVTLIGLLTVTVLRYDNCTPNAAPRFSPTTTK